MEALAPAEGDLNRFWFALRVKPRHEKTAAWALRLKGFEEFLPLYRARSRWSDRIKELELPLFPRYIFCKFTPPERLRVLTTPGVQVVVGNGSTPVPVAAAEIAAIEAIIESGVAAQPWPFLLAGHLVRIVAGPLAGLEGVLLEVKNQFRLLVSVTLLQRSVAVEIDPLSVIPIGAARRPPAPVGAGSFAPERRH